MLNDVLDIHFSEFLFRQAVNLANIDGKSQCPLRIRKPVLDFIYNQCKRKGKAKN